MGDQRFVVRHDADQSRYALIDRGDAGDQAQVIGQEVYLDFRSSPAEAPTDRILFHTEVSDDYSGQGLASVLVETAITETIAAGLMVVPVCPYVVSWLRKHGQYAVHVASVRPAHLEAVKETQQR
jgi:predicted GNAT family acetyltransferase